VSFTNFWESLNMTSKLSRTPARSIELSLTVGVTQAALSDTGLDLTTGHSVRQELRGGRLMSKVIKSFYDHS
jgi:hypothetical protein